MNIVVLVLILISSVYITGYMSGTIAKSEYPRVKSVSKLEDGIAVSVLVTIIVAVTAYLVKIATTQQM